MELRAQMRTTKRRITKNVPSDEHGRYRADITAGALKLRESRVIAGLLLKGVIEQEWQQAVVKENVLQARNPATAVKFSHSSSRHIPSLSTII
jgi:hypothetical protein